MEKSVENLGVIDFLSSMSKLHPEDATKLKKVFASYRQLEKKYIKSQQKDLYDNLEKEKDIVLSYFDKFEKSDLRKINAYLQEISQDPSFTDENFYTPTRKIDFIRLAYNKGNWQIGDDISTRDIPNAINLLTQVAERMDPQEAAYNLTNAKELGEFYIVANAYADYNSDEYKNALETRYMKEPSIPQKVEEKGYVSGFDKPVSRQLASQEENFATEYDYRNQGKKPEKGEIDPETDIIQGMTYLGRDSQLRTLTAINNDMVITNLEEEFTKDEVTDKIKKGEWVLQASKKYEKLIEDIDEILEDSKEKALYVEASSEIAAENAKNVEEALEKTMKKLDAKIALVEPTMKKIANKMEVIKLKDDDSGKKLVRIKENIKGFILHYNPEVKEYAKKVKPIEEVEKIVAQMKKLVSPRNIHAFQELSENLYQYTGITENLKLVVDRRDPKVMERVKQKIEEIKNAVKKNTASIKCHPAIKDKSYIKANYLLENDLIDFEDYDIISDLIEKSPITAALKINELYKVAKDNKVIKASIVEDVKNTIVNFFNSVKEKLSYYLGFSTIQEKESVKINEELGKVLEELEMDDSKEIEIEEEVK